MKKIFTTLIFIQLSLLQVSGQDYKKAIVTDFSTYLELLVNKEFDASMNYILPTFFDIVPRDQMVQVMDQTFNNPDIQIAFLEPQVLQVGEPQKIEERYYALLTYSNIMLMSVSSDDSETEEDKKQRIALTTVSLNQSFGADNVSYDEETDSFEIYSEKDAYAISENGASDWKFLVVEKAQMPILEQLLPKELIEDL